MPRDADRRFVEPVTGTAGSSTAVVGDDADHRRALALLGIDALDTHREPPGAVVQRAWAAAWPKLAAVVIFLGLWQGGAWSGFRPAYLFPGPVPVLQRLGEAQLRDAELVIVHSAKGGERNELAQSR